MKTKLLSIIFIALILISVASVSAISPKEQYGEEFFYNNLVDDNGGVWCTVQTNLPEEPEACSNHEFGSERQGLAMLYYAKAGEQEKFDELYEFLDDKMLSEHGLIYWKLDEDYDNSDYTASASIDDLRIVKSLLVAYENFGEEKYLDSALEIADGLKENAVLRDRFFTEGASWDNDEVYTVKKLYLSYADLNVMNHLAEYDSDWRKIRTYTGAVLKRGSYGNGLFKEVFNYKTLRYKENNNLNSIQQATIGLNLVNYDRTLAQENLDFWKDKWENDLLDGQYHHIASSYDKNGNARCVWCADISVYSLIAQLAHELGDYEFEDEMLNAINQIQNGDYRGAFAWSQNDQLSSYGNALSLVALAEQRN